ncbi:MAG: DoxX family protein [Chitinophagales bacterium]|nr:DoxX family protein [Chitinophagales bacterium]
MKSKSNIDISLLLLRLVTGALFLPHGIAKIMRGFGGVKAMLANKGLPEILWVGTFLGEVIAPVCLILGLFSRISGLLIAGVMVFAVILTEGSNAFTTGGSGGFIGELNFLYFTNGILFFIMGAGKYSLSIKSNKFLLQ